MLLKDIPKESAERLISALADLRPGMAVRIVVVDYALHDLGFVPYVPCSVEVEATENEIFDLLDEIEQMEIDYLIFEDRNLKSPEAAKRLKELKDRYSKYSIIETCFRDY